MLCMSADSDSVVSTVLAQYLVPCCACELILIPWSVLYWHSTCLHVMCYSIHTEPTTEGAETVSSPTRPETTPPPVESEPTSTLIEERQPEGTVCRQTEVVALAV